MIPIKIKEISVCHGNKVVDNTPYLEHFKKQGKDVEHFLHDVIGRDKRYLFDSEEDNSLTYGILAAKDVLKKRDTAVPIWILSFLQSASRVYCAAVLHAHSPRNRWKKRMHLLRYERELRRYDDCTGTSQ